MPGFGTQLIAPEGCQSLSADRTYHYLGRHGQDQRVVLCSFDYPRREAILEYLAEADFETYIDNGSLVVRNPQNSLPDWLEPAISRSQDPKDSFSLANYKTKHQHAVTTRHDRLAPLLANTTGILGLDNPHQEISRLARQLNLNEGRFCFDFFTTVAFGNSKWALLPVHFKKGHYDRSDGAHKKLGPKHKARGANYGWPVTANMRDKMYQGFDKFAVDGVPLSSVWGDTLTEIFGCKVRRNGDRFEYYHPNSEPFPTYRQFRYAIIKHYGIDLVRTKKHGEQYVRNKRRPSKGPFTEAVANIHEQVYADGYFVKEVPRGERDGNPMPPLCVVRIRDAATGYLSGIGFSIGAETMAAYQMALFCMAVPKSLFGRFMGVDITDDEWSISGMPASLKVDGGPGSRLIQIDFHDYDDEVTFQGLAPAYAPQSKAVIESTNPRHVKVSGPPRYVETDLTYGQLAQREICRTVRDNHRIDVSARLTVKMKRAGVVATPHGLFHYLDQRMRNDSQQMPLDTAIRMFLPTVKVKLTPNGIDFHGQLYNSNPLRDSGLLERAARSGETPMDAHILSLNVRQLWLDAHGKTIECQARLPLRDDARQLDVALDDLIQLEQLQRAAAILDGESRIAADSEFKRRFKELSGHDWDGTSKRGRPKTHSPDSRDEFKDHKKTVGAARR
jgi:hypothetical protein